MLVWINGPFGGGKTQTAHELHRRLPGSVVCDPEHAGIGLHRMMPRELRGDFQDFAAWRSGVAEVLDEVLRRHTGGPVLAPMTLVDPGYFTEIVGRLRGQGHTVHHFALLADRKTVLKRLRERSAVHALRGRHPLKQESFAVRRLDDCLERLSQPQFAEHVHTDRLTVPQVADRVAAMAGVRLRPTTDGPARRFLRTTWTSIKHIRLG
ncbi:AAA family ATPase [Nocardiopsis coralliicola]